MPDLTDDQANPDIAAELRLIRAEIAALRNPPAAPPKPHAWFPGFDAAGHLILPRQHYRLTGKLRKWLHLRIHAGKMPHAKISKQRKTAIWLTITAAIRVLVWTLAMGIIVLHWLGVGGSFIHGFTTLSGTVIFVTFISFYCNAATDGASLTASIAALFSADSHAATIASGAATATDLDSIEDDIARLADLQPGPDAVSLAADIRARLAVRVG